MTVTLEWQDVRPVPDGPPMLSSVTPDEAAQLARLAAGKRVLEIGAAYGYSAIVMALGGAEHVTSVDDHNGRTWLGDTFTVMRRNLAACGVSDRVSMVCGRSENVLPALAARFGTSFGLIFIDGDHTYAAVRADILNALPLLDGGGVLACHDYGEVGCPGVKQALDELFPAGPDELTGTLFQVRPPPAAVGWAGPPGIEVVTRHPLADASVDHLCPMGTAHDNSVSPAFNERLFRLVPAANLRLLDLGCAGGGLVGSLLDAGAFAVGVEGSDYSQRLGRAEWARYPGNLFTADVTQPFHVRANGVPQSFNVVTAWEFLEHIPGDGLAGVARNVREHLEPGGLFIASVSTITATGPGQPVEYHASIHPEHWWRLWLAEEGFTVRDELWGHFHPHWVRAPDGPTGSFCVVATV